MPEITIRTGTIEDAEAIVGILNPIIATGAYTALAGPLSIEDERRFIRDFPARGVFHVAVDERGLVVGVQTLEPFAPFSPAFDHVGVMGTYVDLARRRTGVGSRLFERTFAAAVERGYEKVFTYVRADNPDALRAYTRHGFRTIGVASKQARIGGRYIDEILIEKMLVE